MNITVQSYYHTKRYWLIRLWTGTKHDLFWIKMKIWFIDSWKLSSGIFVQAWVPRLLVVIRENLLPCNQMFDKDLQSRNEVSPGSITASSSVQLYFLSGGICNLNTGLMNPKWYKQYGIKSDDCGHQAVRCLCSGWTGWEGIKSLKPNLSGMTLYKFPVSTPSSSLLSPL